MNSYKILTRKFHHLNLCGIRDIFNLVRPCPFEFCTNHEFFGRGRVTNMLITPSNKFFKTGNFFCVLIKHWLIIWNTKHQFLSIVRFPVAIYLKIFHSMKTSNCLPQNEALIIWKMLNQNLKSVSFYID